MIPTFRWGASSATVGETIAEVVMLLCRIVALSFVAFLLASKWGNLPHADTQALQGTWEIVSVERAGTPDPSPVGFTLRFVGDEVRFQAPLDGAWQHAVAGVEPLGAQVKLLNAEKMQRLARY